MARVKSILIIGGSGFVGMNLSLQLREKYKVYSTYYKHKISVPGVTYVPFDIGERDWAKRVVFTARPEIVIYCAGRPEMEHAEKNPGDAENTNTGGPAVALTAADIMQPKFILLSSSYVFDGSKGNYRPESNTLPFTTIGKTKVGGENFIKGKSLNHVIIRSAPVFGFGNGINSNFLDILRIRLDRGERVEILENELHNFAPVYGLCDMVQKVIESGAKNKTFHYGGLSKVSKVDFAKAFAKRFGYNPDNILVKRSAHANSEMAIAQTYDYSLNFSEAVKTLKVKPLFLEEGFDLLEQHVLRRS